MSLKGQTQQWRAAPVNVGLGQMSGPDGSDRHHDPRLVFSRARVRTPLAATVIRAQDRSSLSAPSSEGSLSIQMLTYARRVARSEICQLQSFAKDLVIRSTASV